MDLLRAQRVAIVCSELVDDKLVEHSLDVLEIRHVAACTDHCVGSDGLQTLDIFESCKRSVGCCLTCVV